MEQAIEQVIEPVIAQVVEPVTEVAQVVEQVAEVAQVVEPVVEVTQVVEQVIEQVAEVAQVVEPVVEVTQVVEQVAEVAQVVEEENLSMVTQKEALERVIEEENIVVEIQKEALEQVIELTPIVEELNSLTPIQKEALDVVFNDIKSVVEHILIDADISIQIKIMQMIVPIIKTVQDFSSIKLALTGADKKAVALECGRKCIKMLLKDHLDMLMLYSTIAEPALETMLDLSRKLKPIQEQLKEESSPACCLELLSACLSLKNK